MRTSAVCLILSAAVLYFANGNNGFSSLDSPTAIPELQGKWNSQLIASMTGKQVSCKEMYVEFRSHSLAMASKKGTKTWMTVNDASVSDNLIRFVAVNAKDNKQPMVIYLRRDGDSLRLVEVRDAKDKKSINELPKDIPESMRDTLQKLLTVTHDMMDKMFTMEKCPEA